MNRKKLILLSLILFILLIILSLLFFINYKEEKECVIKIFGDYEVYDLQIYNEPVFMKENSYQLINSNFQPEWYLGFSAVLCPYNFKNIQSRDNALHSTVINEQGKAFLDSIYYKYKNIKEGTPFLRAENYSIVCTRTIKVKNIKTKRKYLIIPLNSFSLKEGFYNNSEENSLTTTFSMAFEFDESMYKSTAGVTLIDLVESTTVYSEILSYTDLDKIVELKETDCYKVINTNNEKEFSDKKLPKWLFKKVNSK